MKQTKTVQVLLLGKVAKDPAAGTSCRVAGWGTIKNKGPMSDVLRAANVTVIDREKCNSPDYYGLKPVITLGMICAGSHGSKRVDTCQVSAFGELLQAETTGVTAMYVNNKGHVLCVFCPGGFRRPTFVRWSSSRCHVFWKGVWHPQKTRSVLLPVRKNA